MLGKQVGDLDRLSGTALLDHNRECEASSCSHVSAPLARTDALLTLYGEVQQRAGVAEAETEDHFQTLHESDCGEQRGEDKLWRSVKTVRNDRDKETVDLYLLLEYTLLRYV